MDKHYYESLYPVGSRVEIVSLANYEPNYPVGLQGRVTHIDDACGIHVAWDNGGSIALLPKDGDVFKRIS